MLASVSKLLISNKTASRLAVFACALPLLTLAAFQASASERLEDVRVWAGPDSTRVVFDLSGSIEHRLFMLDNPARVVIDVDGAVTNAAQRTTREGSGAVRRVRVGQRDDTTVRLVLDLQEISRAKSFVLAPQGRYGHRLVIDVSPVAAAESASGQTTAGRSVPQVALGYKPIVVAIDAGHGGEDPGSSGPAGTIEKNVALEIARRLQRKVNAQDGMRAVMIRDGDYYVGLRERISKARAAQADLFISIHADAFTDGRPHGTSVYVLSKRGASSEHARTLAQRENASDLIGGVRLDDKDDVLASVLIDISQTAAMEASFDVGGRMLTELGSVNSLHKDTVQQAGFAVLKAPDMPSVLIETGFISNRAEERRLRTAAYQERLANQMMAGIRGYFSDYRPHTTTSVAGGPARQYVVRSGDTLSTIASQFSTSLTTLRSFNALATDMIRVGDVLQIPPG